MELELHKDKCKNIPKIEYRTKKSGSSNCGIGNSMSRPGMRREPAKKTDLKFTMRGGPRHGVACMWDQPELNVSGRCRSYQLRMPWSDIRVRIAMDQQYGNCRMRHGLQRAGLQQVYSISKTRVQNC